MKATTKPITGKSLSDSFPETQLPKTTQPLPKEAVPNKDKRATAEELSNLAKHFSK